MNYCADVERGLVVPSSIKTELTVSDQVETCQLGQQVSRQCWLDDFRQMVGCCQRNLAQVMNPRVSEASVVQAARIWATLVGLGQLCWDELGERYRRRIGQ